ncbi:glycosyltransferase [Microbacterium sp. NPDC056234]|uniref:glycosyltransferase n=1 Tax=Microbacterium sp. NPDC056234 TaxID=3345757 RepID=UPI0035DE2D31
MTARRTVAVFSTFGPADAAVRAVTSVVGQVDRVIVVDDGSGPDADAALERISGLGAQVERLDRNAGIAAALNRGIALARDGGATYVLTMDQDSHAPDGLVAGLLAAAEAAEADGIRFGAIVPEYFAGVRQARGAARNGHAPAAEVIQSGMLIPIEVLDDVGALREDFFIDLVDIEFELRLKRAGLAVLAADGVRLGHALGASYDRTLFGLPVRVPGIPPVLTLSTPFRYFYRVRNRLVIDREYFCAMPARILRDTLFDGIHFVDVLRVARPRRVMWRVFRVAAVAAVRGRMGAMPQGLREIAGTIRWSAAPIQGAAPDERPDA